MTRHEPCPACGDQMRLRSWSDVTKVDRQCYLECQGCNLLYEFNVYNGGGTYQNPESLWYAWDTSISEQRGKWLEEHPCDGCVTKDANS
jgi:ssDNA-binding Zn-finger/Zn-ribbon topoisomerase 1